MWGHNHRGCSVIISCTQSEVAAWAARVLLDVGVYSGDAARARVLLDVSVYSGDARARARVLLGVGVTRE